MKFLVQWSVVIDAEDQAAAIRVAKDWGTVSDGIMIDRDCTLQVTPAEQITDASPELSNGFWIAKTRGFYIIVYLDLGRSEVTEVGDEIPANPDKYEFISKIDLPDDEVAA